MIKTLAWALWINLLVTQAFADGLGMPFDFEDASTLPKGIRTFKVRSFTTEVESKFDYNGSIQPLGKSFQANLKMSQIYKGKSASEVAMTKGYMQSLGIDPNTADLGTIDGYAAARVTATIPVLGYGLTNTWTVAIAVPVVYSNTYASTGFSASSTAQKFFGYLNSDTSHNKAKMAQQQLTDPVNGQLASLGYDPLKGEVRTQLGDIRLISKNLLFQGGNFSFATKESLVLPTGSQASPNQVVAVAAGDGQWDVGAAAILDWFLNSKVTITTHGEYTVQLPGTTPKRIPIAPDSTLGELDSSTSRDYGDIAGASLAFKYLAMEGLTVGTSYMAQKKYSDIYHGTAFAPERYDWLSRNSDQYMESALFGVSYSTVPLYRKGAFAVPGDFRLSYATVVKGINVPADDMASAEVAIYF